jgi:acyl-CoA thioesterase I
VLKIIQARCPNLLTGGLRMNTLMKDQTTILFIGDSITDAGRSFDNSAVFGSGYMNMIAAFFPTLYPEKNVCFINKGIGGNRVKDLKARWQEDCLDLKPDWVSIMIGINDCWRRFDCNDPTTTESYENDYKYILAQTRDQLHARLIIFEPFLLQISTDLNKWRDDLDPKIQATRRLAIEFGAIYIPLDGLFAQMSTQKPPKFWSQDGVHPSQAGHALIAQQWLEAVKIL